MRLLRWIKERGKTTLQYLIGWFLLDRDCKQCENCKKDLFDHYRCSLAEDCKRCLACIEVKTSGTREHVSLLNIKPY